MAEKVTAQKRRGSARNLNPSATKGRKTQEDRKKAFKEARKTTDEMAAEVKPGIRKRIKQVIKTRAGGKQVRLAEITGIPGVTIRGWLRPTAKQTIPGGKSLLALRFATGYSPTWVLLGEDHQLADPVAVALHDVCRLYIRSRPDLSADAAARIEEHLGRPPDLLDHVVKCSVAAAESLAILGAKAPVETRKAWQGPDAAAEEVGERTYAEVAAGGLTGPGTP